MKKHLIAAAVAAAVAAPAMAQNVTLYGTIDAGVATLSGVGAADTSETVYTDGALSSSVWGLRGTEDLGGGLRAVFNVESDIQTNNGGISHWGLFRRASWVGVAGQFGELTFGMRVNPLIAINGALMPMSGNSVSTLTSGAFGYADFYTKNAVTYTTPNLSGLVAQVQYGFGNSLTPATPGGSVLAGSLTYAIGPVTLRAAMHDRKENGTTSGANATPANFGTATTIDLAATAYVMGIAYSAGPLSLAGAVLQNKEQAVAGGAKLERSGQQFGARYALSPALAIGGSYTRGEGSSLTNAQARYTLSKRTTAYALYGVSDNASTSASTVLFLPMSVNTGQSPARILSDYAAGTNNRKSSAIGAGLIHTF